MKNFVDRVCWSVAAVDRGIEGVSEIVLAQCSILAMQNSCDASDDINSVDRRFAQSFAVALGDLRRA